MTEYKLKYIAPVLAIAASILAGCKPEYEPDPSFLSSDRIMLVIGGTEKMSYSPEYGQLGFCRELKQFRVSNDNMSEYYVLTCNAIPTAEGQTVKGSVKYASGTSSYVRNDLSFKVEKMDMNGNIWLWCKEKGIGVSVRTLN